MNPTIEKFGHPATLVADYVHWVVLLRPAQPTLGSLVLAARSDATAFGALEPAAHAELARVTADIEAALRAAVSYEKINYLMLMLVDPHVHFHVVPRYRGERRGAGLAIADPAWGQPPALADARKLDPEEQARLVAWLKGYWPA